MSVTQHPLLVQLLLCSIAAKGVAQTGVMGVTIDTIHPRSGSFAGGTLVTILGKGFARAGMAGTTTVMIGEVPCEIITYYMTDDRIICTSGMLRDQASGSRQLPVQVAAYTMADVAFSVCQDSVSRCNFWYHNDATPYIATSTTSAAVGSELTFSGVLRGVNTSMYTITIGGINCDIVNEFTMTDSSGVVIDMSTTRRHERRSLEIQERKSIDAFLPETGAVDVEPTEVVDKWWKSATLQCVTSSELEPGHHNYTVHVAPHWSAWNLGGGNAVFNDKSSDTFPQDMMTASGNGSAHTLTLVPQVLSLSTHVSGSLGGDTLLIEGVGFSSTCAANVVEVAGVDCAIISCNRTQIECIVGDNSSAVTSTSSQIPSTAGITRKVWFGGQYSLDFETALSNFASPDIDETVLDGWVFPSIRDEGNHYSQEHVAHFVAPHTANYSFWIGGDDLTRLEFNEHGTNFSEVVTVASKYGWTDSYTAAASQKSSSISLVAGHRYAMRTRHREGNGNGYVQAAVEIQNAPDMDLSSKHHRVHEIQRIQFAADGTWQQQTLALANTTGGQLGFLDSSDKVHWVSIGASIDSDQLDDVLSEITECSDFLFNYVEDLAVFGNASLVITYKCIPRTTTDGLAVVPFSNLRVVSENLTVGVNASQPVVTVATTQMPSLPLGGSFRIGMDGMWSELLLYGRASTATTRNNVIDGLKSFPSVQSVVASNYGNAGYESTITITFLAPYGINHPEIVVDTSSMLGNATATVTTLQQGNPTSLLYDPIPLEFVETATRLPSVVVRSNTILAACADTASCVFNYDATVTGLVLAVTASSGVAVEHGGTLTITGERLQHNGGGVTVAFGGAPCTVASHSATAIVCTVSHATYGAYTPVVVVAGTGTAAVGSSVEDILYNFAVDTVFPASSGYRGGTRVTLMGTGFSPAGDNGITIGGAPCNEDVVVSRSDQIVCVAPAWSNTSLPTLSHTALPVSTEETLVVSRFDNYSHAQPFVYVQALTPSITMVTPDQISAAKTVQITVSGAFTSGGFSTQECSRPVLQFVSPSGKVRTCSNLVFTDSYASCVLVRGAAFPVSEQAQTGVRLVVCADHGGSIIDVVAHPEPAYQHVDLALRIHGTDTVRGSLAGGTPLVIYGAGFADDTENIINNALTYNYESPMMVVNITLPDRTVPCMLTHSNFTTVECETTLPTGLSATHTAFPPHEYTGDGYNGIVAVTVNNIEVPGCANTGAIPPPVETVMVTYVAGVGEYCADAMDLCIAWAPGSTNAQIEFTLTANVTEGYFSVGFSDEHFSMGPADVATCQIEGGVMHVRDRYNVRRGVNIADVSSDLSLTGGVVNMTAGTATCSFVRDIIATDQVHDRSIRAGLNNVIYCMGSLQDTPPRPSYHGATDRGGVQLAFLEAQNVTVNVTSGVAFDAHLAPVHMFSDVRVSTCSFDFADSATPAVAGVSPESGFGATSVVLVGSGFVSQPEVLVGTEACVVTAFNESAIHCDIPALVSGWYRFRVFVSPHGIAAHTTVEAVGFRSDLSISQIEPNVSSTAGGLVLTMTGTGFSDKKENNSLLIGGVAAHIIHAERGIIVAVSPVHAEGAVGVALSVTTQHVPNFLYGAREPVTWTYTRDVSCHDHVAVSTTSHTQGAACAIAAPNASCHACDIAYSAAATPTIDAVAPVQGFAGDTITITGTGLAGANVTEVLIGQRLCAVTSGNDTHISCEVGATRAGAHTIYVTVHGRGTASGAVTFTSLLEVTAVDQSSGSFGGGTNITLTGRGFGGNNVLATAVRRVRRAMDAAWGGWELIDQEILAEEDEELGSRIAICNQNCTVLESQYNRVVCVTEPLNTPESIIAYNNNEVARLGTETLISSDMAQAANAFDANFTTVFNAAWVGVDLGVDTRALVTKVRFFPQHQYREETEGGTFETSQDGANWTVVGTIASPNQGWNWISQIPLAGQKGARFIRYVAPGSVGRISMIEFYGYPVRATPVCPITVDVTTPLSHPSLGIMHSDHAVMVSQPSGHVFTYAANMTGHVSGIHPRYGTALGGERVTITGTNLGGAADTTHVEINHVACVVDVVSAAGDRVECVTQPRGPILRHNAVSQYIEVHDVRPGRGVATVDIAVTYRYLDKWSSINTWLNNEPPVEGDSVIIPVDQTILLDESPPRLFLLLVLGSLVFDRTDLNLDASYIFIQGGRFEVGTEDEPFLHNATITLHGHRQTSIEIPFIGAKVLAVADRGGFSTHGNGTGAEVPESQKGVLDIHGRPRVRTWTKTAPGVIPAGSHRITTTEVTDFAPGEKIVLTAPHQELTVAARIDDFTFTVVEPIAEEHVSEWRNHSGDGGTFELDMRGEVALLSRNVLIQGQGPPRLDGTPTLAQGEVSSEEMLFGVHTGAFHGGYYRVENTELRHCGQAGVLGRYCMHYHVNGDNPPPNSYIKSNSIHHSFQRATTVHGTHHALVQNNVAYHVMGHTYFVEDGDETYNVFDNNIGIHTRRSHMMLKSDMGPATFWTAIPTNFWRNNVATDSVDRGAWFELTDQGVTLEFKNNTFHHNGGIGWRNYPNYSPPSDQYFHNNSYFRNGGNGLFYKKGGDNHHVYSKFAENGVDVFWTKYEVDQAAVDRNIPNLQDCVFWGGVNAQAIFAPQHEFWYVNGSTFINYDRDATTRGVLSACAGCCSAVTFRQGAYTTRFENLHWINSTRRTEWTCPFKQIMYDLDGSLTGWAGGTALPLYKFNNWTGACTEDRTGVYDHGTWAAGGMVCNNDVRVRRLQIYNTQPSDLQYKAISLKKSQRTDMGRDVYGAVNWTLYTHTGQLYDGDCMSGNAAGDFNPADFSGCDVMEGLDWVNYRNCNADYDGWAVPLVTSRDYYVDFDWHVDFQEMDVRWSEPEYLYEAHNLPLTGEESVLLRFPYVDYRYQYRLDMDGNYMRDTVAPWYDSDTNRTNVTRHDDFGASFINRDDNSKRTTGAFGVLDVAVNPYSVGLNDTRASNPLELKMQALQCGPNMCGLPGDIPENWPAPRLWSDPATWTFIAGQLHNTMSVVPTGRIPVVGDQVEIPAGIFVVLDVSTPRLSKLVVVGRLDFQQGMDIALHVDRMLVWGMLNIGIAEEPFTGNAEIVLRGLRTSPTLVATDQHFLGNKNLVVFGIANLYGQSKARTWTQLQTTALPSDTSITTTADVTGWSVGDRIAIAGTEYASPVDIYNQPTGFGMDNYSAHEMEERIITSISGRTLSFAKPLQHRHFAGDISTSNGNVQLRAHVGLLSSNVVVRGEVSDAPADGPYWYSGYGGHVVVGEVNYGSQEELDAMIAAGEILQTTRKLGSLHASWVEFRDMGKLASEHGAIVYRFFSDLLPREYPTNEVVNCVFPNTWNHAMATKKAFGVEFVGNMVHKSFKNGVEVDMESRGVQINDNLVMGNQRSVDMYNPNCHLDESCWNQPFAAFSIQNTHMAAFRGNVAANAEDIGILIIPTDACASASGARVIRSNQAYGALVGVFVLDAYMDTCVVVDGMMAWKNAHVGILSVDQMADLVLEGAVVADNHEGISLNFVKQGMDATSTVQNSFVLGSTAASTCAASVQCHAIVGSDARGLGCNSEFGMVWRRVGIVLPQYTNLAKTCQRAHMYGAVDGQQCSSFASVNRICSLPYENRFGNVDVQHAEFNIVSTTFAYWATDDCGLRSRAIAVNPSQPDLTPTMNFNALTWEAYDNTSRFVLSDTDQQRHEAVACVDSCDAINYMTIHDLDGTTHGAFGSRNGTIGPVTILSAKNLPATDATKCRTHGATGSVVCNDYNIKRMTLESNPPRFTHRRMGPTKVTKYGAAAADAATYWSVGPFPQSCSCQKHFAQFSFGVEVGRTHNVNTTGVLESRNRLSFFSEDPSECVLVRLFVDKPKPVKVTALTEDGTEMLRLTNGTYPAVGDGFPSGTSTLNPQERLLYIKLCGGATKVYWLVYENMIMVTATLSMTVDQFFANDDGLDYQAGTENFVSNLAALLGIASSQIKVTCVHSTASPGNCFSASSFARRARSVDTNADDAVVRLRRDANSTTSTTVTTTSGQLVIDFTVRPKFTQTSASTVGNDTVLTNESTTEEQQLAELDSLFSALVDNQVTIVQGMAARGYVIMGLSASYDPDTTTTMASATTGSGTVDDDDTQDGSVASSSNTRTVVAAAVSTTVVCLLIVGAVLFRMKQKQQARKQQPKATDDGFFNPTFSKAPLAEFSVTTDKSDFVTPQTSVAGAMTMEPDTDIHALPMEDEPSYFQPGKRAVLQQDSLMVKTGKRRSSASVESGVAALNYVDVAPDESTPHDIRPSALQHTEDPRFVPTLHRNPSNDGRISVVRGSVHKKTIAFETDELGSSIASDPLCDPQVLASGGCGSGDITTTHML